MGLAGAAPLAALDLGGFLALDAGVGVSSPERDSESEPDALDESDPEPFCSASRARF